MLVIALSCKPSSSSIKPEVPHVVIDGCNIELVADEDGNQYLKQYTPSVCIFIPFPYETSEPKDSIIYYQAKK